MGWKRRLLAWLCWLPLVSCGPTERVEPLTEIDWDNARVEEGFAVGYLSPGQIEVAGQQRDYAIYLPPSYDRQQTIPMVINFHAFNAAGPKQERISRMTPIADEAGFILVYPNAMGSPASWNYRAGMANNADLQFVASLIETLPERLAVDRSKIFVMGLSNGGGFAHRVACELGQFVQGLATVAGVYPAAGSCAGAMSIPVIAFHGNADTVVPFLGGGAQNLLGVDYWAAGWAERNGCANPEITVDERYTLSSWQNCNDKAVVQLYELHDWDHFWPNPDDVPEDMVDSGVNASRLIWDFFKTIGDGT